MKYLGIDYGLAHLGLATADGPLAVPLRSLDMPPDQALLALPKLVAAEGIGAVVVGIPEGPLALSVQEFAQKLESLLSVPVVLHPETLSTKEAVAALRKSGASRKKLRADHVYAACLILEDYLNSTSTPEL